MVSRKEINDKYFTKDGLSFIKTKIKSMITLCNKNKFPVSVKIFGFGDLVVENSEEMVGRIIELCELIGFQINISKIEVNGKEEVFIK